jgi:hypothetical protein
MRTGILLCCLLLVTACAHRPAGPTPPLDREFTLARGETAAIEDTTLLLRFTRVSGDSRCPQDAICIQGGDAVVHIRASGQGAPADLELHTGDSSRARATYGSYLVALTELQPYPFSTRTIEQDEYRATLRVARP